MKSLKFFTKEIPLFLATAAAIANLSGCSAASAGSLDNTNNVGQNPIVQQIAKKVQSCLEKNSPVCRVSVVSNEDVKTLRSQIKDGLSKGGYNQMPVCAVVDNGNGDITCWAGKNQNENKYPGAGK